ncbi:hypothetical protein ACT3SZ_14810 [Corynebacterium sp. AOP40-9SA-29]|uniref:hypothetical protein n=1 Tax=Corynebacterium sp. AOP40-9SA-29 TaxID=3457677 RepID=UPI0040341430
MSRTYPYGALRVLSEQRYPDLQTAVTRLADETSGPPLGAHSVRLQLEGIAELTDELLDRIAEDTETSDDITGLRKLLTETADAENGYIAGLENLREDIIAGATFRNIR